LIRRTPPHDTTKLVTLLEPLTEWGLPLEEVLIEGMGRFVVAARANYSDDWLAARYTPTFHLHKGLDIFAEMGAPIRSPDAGVVAHFSDSYPGGIGVTIRNHQGRTYYFGHMTERAPELQVGQSVEVGTVLGYVGDTGNADGGPPHLHLEVRDHGVAIPPKPIVDSWLEEAENAAGDFIEARRVEIDLGRQFAARIGAEGDLAEYQLDLLLGPPDG
jgi:murein DD-endopeptidase MepM/ murein hydrolase activator NlpD